MRAISRQGGQVAVTTQGDANATQEHWRVPVDGTIGTVVYRVPLLGFAVGRIGSPAGRIGLIVVPAPQLPLGSVNLGRNDYVSANATFGVTGTASTMVQSVNAIRSRSTPHPQAPAPLHPPAR